MALWRGGVSYERGTPVVTRTLPDFYGEGRQGRKLPPAEQRLGEIDGCGSCHPRVLGGTVHGERSERGSSLETEFFIDNILVRIHLIIVMIRWTGLAPWEFEFGLHCPVRLRAGAEAASNRPGGNPGAQR